MVALCHGKQKSTPLQFPDVSLEEAFYLAYHRQPGLKQWQLGSGKNPVPFGILAGRSPLLATGPWTGTVALFSVKQNSPHQFSDVSLKEAFSTPEGASVIGGGRLGLGEIPRCSEF